MASEPGAPRLRLRRGVVRSADDLGGVAEQQLTVELSDDVQPAIANTILVGRCRVGDEVLVNVAARERALGSGGFDIVHANLTRGLDAPATAPTADAVKLNYTSLQHLVVAVDAQVPEPATRLRAGAAVAVIALHGQLAALAWAFARSAPGARLGYVQTAGGALPADHSRTAPELRRRELLASHIAAGPAFGGPDGDAITTAGALAYGFSRLGWAAAVCGPGPGIVGSRSTLGHGGLVALDSAHVALALGAATVLVARMSSSDPRAEHRGLSHHTRTVLDLLLAGVTVALPTGEPEPTARGKHRWAHHDYDLAGYAASGLPSDVMGRSLDSDPLFFAAALAGGGVLAELAARRA